MLTERKHMKNLWLIGLIVFIGFSTQAQTELEKIVQEGVSWHEKGEYDKAVQTYKKGLKKYPKSALLNYEIALSYYTQGDFKNCVSYSDKVIKQNDEYLLQAYMSKGSALDNMGQTDESVKVLKEAIKKLGDDYLLHYNLGLNYYKLSDYASAEQHILKAIEDNANHSSSHLILAFVNDEMGNVAKAMLSAYYYLLLEPGSARSIHAYKLIQESFGANVSKDKDDPKRINISIPKTEGDEENEDFRAAELMVSMLAASQMTEDSEGKTDEEKFRENTQSFFNILGELNKEKEEDIWWSFYVPLFYEMASSDHLEAFCYYISQSGNEQAVQWLEEHGEALEQFGKWLEE